MTGRGATRDPVAWEEADSWLTSSRFYWIVTVRPDGHPYTRPVWGVWSEPWFHFATSPQTRTARNLARQGRAVVHPESAADVVIIEGVVCRTTEPALIAAAAAYEQKYDWRIEATDPGMPFYSLHAETAVAWRAQDPRGSAARWQLLAKGR